MSAAYNVTDFFGCDVFNEKAMAERLPEKVLLAVEKTMKDGVPMSLDDIGIFAEALKNWAVEKGATHYAHWFQPMTGVTAEKHESFISYDGGKAINRLLAKELIKGESDASSFPSGGIRATFEARGYTAWDPTSFAFVKDTTLYVPTVFCSFSGETLDKKTPLLRSNQALNKQAMRILRLFGSDAKKVYSTVGAEQEYFLIDKSVYLRRKDLVYTGRTLIGAKPPKGQELDDHYFGAIKPRVAEFMREVDEELWKLGVVAKTEHNEVAPAQHELATMYTDDNAACDQNQLTMEIMKKVADKKDMACLLHEKPFAGINGSGKHNNWSLATDTGLNLLEPGSSPQDNAQFMLFMSAVIKSVDEYQDLLRATVASAGNDHRLGANEAPPAIISIFVGDDIEKIIKAIVAGEKAGSPEKRKLHLGIDVFPPIPADTTDRNRTSPFAFTGNKFEFRMPGSSFSLADPNTILNVIVAESLSQFADRLKSADNFNEELNKLIAETLKKHSRIIFNGDGYSEKWVKEAKRRGLLNISSTPEALPHLTAEKNLKLFAKHNVFTEREMQSRKEILLENYCKTIKIEALTLAEMLDRQIAPAAENYVSQLVATAENKNRIGLGSKYEYDKAQKITAILEKMQEDTENLRQLLDAAQSLEVLQQANALKDVANGVMANLRQYADKLESLCPESSWPIPTYGEILYSVN